MSPCFLSAFNNMSNLGRKSARLLYNTKQKEGVAVPEFIVLKVSHKGR